MRTWIVHTIAVAVALASATAGSAQTTGSVTGTVRDLQTAQPLEGTLVSVAGTRQNALVNAEGRFLILNVPVGTHAVRAERIGFAPGELLVEVRAGGTTVVDFQLRTDAVQLQGVVVVGYGTQRRETVTSSIASVTSDQFVQGPARSAASLIAGKLPGLAVVTPSGNPTANPEIQLRGITTIQGNRSPLVLVDGVPGNLNAVSPEDIEAISVLKDGSAAAIYGSRASNGVILITTKRHDGGQATLRYDGYISQSALYKRPDFLSAADWVRLNQENATTVPFQTLGYATDWIDEAIRNPLSYRHNIALSGGAFNTNYTGSINLDNEQGVFNLSEQTDFSARANIRHQMFDGKLETEGNLVTRRVTNPAGVSYDYIWRQSMIRNPTDRIHDDQGNWQVRDGYFYDNPLQLLNEVWGANESRTTRMHGTMTLRPVRQLRFSGMGGVTWGSGLYGATRSMDHPSSRTGGNWATRSMNSSETRIMELTGTFSEQFLADHNVTLLGGYTYTDNLYESFGASNTRFPGDIFEWNQLGLGDGMARGEASISSGKSSNKLIGFFGRANYDYKNRYLLMASLRHEGDSRFGAGYKWGTFQGLSLGWRVSEESFMDELPWVNELRLRAAYGVTGMAPSESYLSLRSYSYGSNTARFLYNGNWVRTLGPQRNPNPDLKWEEKHETNIGANFALFDSRLHGSVDVYNRETRDMLYNYSVPVPPYVVGSIRANVGTMQNKGVELELGYDVIRRSGFNWTTSANWSRNTNKLVSLSDEARGFTTNQCFGAGHTGEPIQQTTHRNCVGDQIGNFYGWRSVDIDDNGTFIVLDSVGDRILAPLARERDKQILGNGLPKQYFAWNNTAQFRRFDLSVNMRGAAEYQILNLNRAYYENPRNVQYNMLRSAFDPVYGKRTLAGDLTYVSYYIEDGDYIKLDNATLGYRLPEAALSVLGGVARSARVYVSGRNLLTITGYKGLDPEVSTAGLSPGIDARDTYPTIRTFTAGMTVTF
jgi:TonB-dependent starch-binding outer membrane protein SusC